MNGCGIDTECSSRKCVRVPPQEARSKPELLRDLAHYYGTRLTPTNVYLVALPAVPNGVPEIHYSLEERKYYFDGEEVDAPACVPTGASFCDSPRAGGSNLDSAVGGQFESVP